MNRVENAVTLFREGRSCSQALLLAFCDKFGMEREMALKVAAGFGGGMGMGDACGAMTGAFMALGCLFDVNDPGAKDKMHALTREFAGRFKQEAASIHCRDFLGCEVYTPEGREYVKTHNLRTTVCEGLVRRAAILTEEMLERTGK